MTFQISRRSKEYLKAAQTLLRTAQTMIDGVVESQLKALADDYQRGARVSHVDAAKACARSEHQAEHLAVCGCAIGKQDGREA
jgi:hypothetical protein